MKTLYLFPDTNIFIQCQQLDQNLDWSTWEHFDAIELIVTRPVIEEIDRQKQGKNTRPLAEDDQVPPTSNSRIEKRARAATALFKKFFENENRCVEIRSSAPRVTLFLRQDLKPDPSLKDELDYRRPDDRIVGIIHAFKASSCSTDVRFLSDDIGARLSADAHRIASESPPAKWLNTTPDEGADLKEQLSWYKKQEPQFEIFCEKDQELKASHLESNSNTHRPTRHVDKLDIEASCYAPLPTERVDELVLQIRTHFPISNEFWSPETKSLEQTSFPPGASQPGLLSSLLSPEGLQSAFEYQTHSYPEWIKQCERTLLNLHSTLEEYVNRFSFMFRVTNAGTRPAENVLVHIQATGGIALMATDGHYPLNNATLNTPPVPPIEPIPRILKSLSTQKYTANVTLPFSHIPSMYSISDVFSWQPKRPKAHTDSFKLECPLWRHRTDPHIFPGEVIRQPSLNLFTNNSGMHWDNPRLFWDKKTGPAQGPFEGELVCTIHATNLTQPAIKKVPVKISVVQKDTNEVAEDLVNRLLQHDA